MDEAANHEEEENQDYKMRIENNKQYKEKIKLSEVEEGMKLDVKDTEGIWCVGVIKTILKLDKSKLLLIHFDKWDEYFDELIPLDSSRIAPFGFYTQRNILRYKLLLPEGNKQGEVIN